VSKTNSLSLDHLANGSHVLKVTAIDDQLNRDATPATATFEVKIDSAKQVALLIALLRHPDFERRKEAVQALARQPARAAPALQAARETANEEQRWWIDAALQEIENQKAATPAKPAAVPNP
jgi:HEAT repeat protein